jgi:hypothetical protein
LKDPIDVPMSFETVIGACMTTQTRRETAAAPAPGKALAAERRHLAHHEFGSGATDLKISLIKDYSCAFTRALRGKFDLCYFDAFAGTGERTERVPGQEAEFFTPATPERIVSHTAPHAGHVV